jgi:hypothetical protein
LESVIGNEKYTPQQLQLTTIAVANLSSFDILKQSSSSKKKSAVVEKLSSGLESPRDNSSTRNDIVNCQISTRVASSLLNFLFSPLIGDLDAFKAFSSALKYEGSFLAGPLGLKHVLPGLLLFLSQQSLHIIVQEILTRKVSTSPIQR